MTATSTVECPQCKQWYDPSKAKQLVRYKCPNCGYETTEFKHVRVNGHVGVSATVSDLEMKSERVEVKKGFDLLVLVLTIGVPIAVYFINPLAGLVVGIATGLFNYWLTPRAKKWISDTRQITIRKPR